MNKVLTEYYEAEAIRNKKGDALDKQTQRIVTVITKFFGVKKDWWWAYDYYEGDIAPSPRQTEDDLFDIYISKECSSDSWMYSEAFPLSFFDMSDDEIWCYLRKEATNDKNREKVKKETKKATTAELRKSAISKLTPQEKKALKL